MKKLLALLATAPLTLTSCLLIYPEDTTPSNPNEPGDENPDGGGDDPVIPAPDLPDFEPEDPDQPNVAPTFSNYEVTLGIHTDIASLDWVSLLGITDDTSLGSEITVVNEGLDYVKGVENVISTRFEAYDKNGASTRAFIEITYEGLGLSDDQIFAAANQMSFQITTTNGVGTYYGSGYSMTQDSTTGELYVMTNMHVVADSSYTTLLTHDYQKTGTFLPNLCAEHEFSSPNKQEPLHYIDLTLLKVTGISSNGALGGCHSPDPYTVDMSLVEFPNLLEIDDLAQSEYYGFPYASSFNNEDVNAYISGFPAAGWDGTNFVGDPSVNVVPTLINRKELIQTTNFYPSLGQSYSSWSPNVEQHGVYSWENNVIRFPGLNVTGGASGSIVLDRNLNLLGTMQLHNATDQMSGIVANDEIRYFIDKYCEDASHSNIDMCK